MRQVLIILVVVVCLGTPGPRQTAWALSPIKINLVEISLSTMAASAVAYYIWKNSPAKGLKDTRRTWGWESGY